jgi:hypothetical protein
MQTTTIAKLALIGAATAPVSHRRVMLRNRHITEYTRQHETCWLTAITVCLVRAARIRVGR